MEAKGNIKNIDKITFLIDSKDQVKNNIIKWMKDKKRIRFYITGEAYISRTESGGTIVLDYPDYVNNTNINLNTWYKKRSYSQLNTLKGLESIIYQLDNGVAPASSDMLWFIHQGIMESANIRIYNPKTDDTSIVTCSSPHCDTKTMNKFIEIALDELSTRNIQDDVRDSLSGKNISELFISWYKKRMIEDDILNLKNWEEYKKMFPWCEFTFKRGTEDDPLQRMHIVSAGADKADYEEPWNWIHASRSIHAKQHQYGWEPILQDYPHLIQKVNKARLIAKNNGILRNSL